MDKEIKDTIKAFKRVFKAEKFYQSFETKEAAVKGLDYLDELVKALRAKDPEAVFWLTGVIVDCLHTCRHFEEIKRGEISGQSKKASPFVEMLWKKQAKELRKENPGISARQMAIQIDESRSERIRKTISEWERKREIPSKK